MGWLKKAGSIIVKVLGVATGILPIVQTATSNGVVTTIGSDLQKVANMVTTVEAVFQAVEGPDAKSGAQKLKAATPLVAQVIQQSELMVGKKVKNEEAFIAACTAITSATADLLNSLE